MSNKYITLTVKVIVDEDNVQDIEEWVNERLSNDARFDLVEVDKKEQPPLSQLTLFTIFYLYPVAIHKTPEEYAHALFKCRHFMLWVR